MEEQTIREGTVIGQAPGQIMVRIDKEEDCEGCRSCAVKAMCRGREEKYMDVPVPVSGDQPPAKGSPVRISYRAANPALAALIMFLPALVGLSLGGFAAAHLWPGSDVLLLAGCLIGVLVGITVTYAATKTMTSLRPHVRLLDN